MRSIAHGFDGRPLIRPRYVFWPTVLVPIPATVL